MSLHDESMSYGTFHHYRVPQSTPYGWYCSLCRAAGRPNGNAGSIKPGEWAYGCRKFNVGCCKECLERGEAVCHAELVTLAQAEKAARAEKRLTAERWGNQYRRRNQVQKILKEHDNDEYGFHTHLVPYDGNIWYCPHCENKNLKPDSISYSNQLLNVGCCEDCFMQHKKSGDLKSMRSTAMKEGFHKHRASNTKERHFLCDLCNTVVDDGEKMYGNRQIDSDACAHCIARYAERYRNEDDALTEVAYRLRQHAARKGKFSVDESLCGGNTAPTMAMLYKQTQEAARQAERSQRGS